MDSFDIKDCFASLEAQNRTIALFKETDVILGHGTDTDNVFVVYGRELLQTIAAGKDGKECTILTVDLRQSTSELEMLLAAVKVAKGFDDYQSFDDQLESADLGQPFIATDGMHRFGGVQWLLGRSDNLKLI